MNTIESSLKQMMHFQERIDRIYRPLQQMHLQTQIWRNSVNYNALQTSALSNLRQNYSPISLKHLLPPTEYRDAFFGVNKIVKQFKPFNLDMRYQLQDTFQVNPFLIHVKSTMPTYVHNDFWLHTLATDVVTATTPNVQNQKIEKLRQFVISKVPKSFIPAHLLPLIIKPFQRMISPEILIGIVGILVGLYCNYQSGEQAERHHQEKMQQDKDYYEMILKELRKSKEPHSSVFFLLHTSQVP